MPSTMMYIGVEELLLLIETNMNANSLNPTSGETCFCSCLKYRTISPFWYCRF